MSGAYYQMTDEEHARVRNSFSFHAPFGDQTMRYEEVRRLGRQFAETLFLLCPRSRELSLAITALEEVVMRANQSIALNEKPIIPGSREAGIADESQPHASL